MCQEPSEAKPFDGDDNSCHAGNIDEHSQPVDTENKIVPDMASTSDRMSSVENSILFIDDTSSVLNLHASELEAHGFRVSIALGPDRALRKLKAASYTVVLCDMRMPGQNGDELVAAFRLWERHNRPNQTKQVICAFTAYDGDTTLAIRCKEAGMNGILSKPMKLDRIMALVRDAEIYYASAAKTSELSETFDMWNDEPLETAAKHHGHEMIMTMPETDEAGMGSD